MKQPIDQLIREQALNTELSFIVQAPAGSGKTELLTQRYLALLAQAHYPEEILAITFTRKAAGEMRDRVINALQRAKHSPDKQKDYLSKTWELAQAVVKRDQQFFWQLLENPSRLRIQTIDALCASITRQMPILSRLGAQPAIAENPYTIYQVAAKEILSTLEQNAPWSDALAILLLHLDNDYAKVEKLLSDMLARRDQWLPYVAGINDAGKLRAILEKSLSDAIAETIIDLANNLTGNIGTELALMARFAATQLLKINATSPIIICQELKQLPEATPQQLPLWLGLAELLLTKHGQWRKKISQSEGFPPQSAATTPAEKLLFSQMKERMNTLIEQMAADENLLQHWLDLRALPPAHYNDTQWEILTALLQLLPVMVAQLQLIFQMQGMVDYIEISQSAITALGDPQAPTDLALSLDYRIHHILVDEFQDTSIAQFRLLEQLTAGWQPADGHTLFLVGDPMQSIYRFRKAEVGLFLQARECGIGNIHLTPLTLTVNFRSQLDIVSWINSTFQILMPRQENMGVGAVTYTPSTAIHTESKLADGYLAAVNVHPVYHVAEEAQTIVAIIQNTYADNANAKIAILVRARTHLLQILPQLRNAGIPYRAIEIETLGERPHIQDVFALTRALLHLGDRIAWLAILRAPWCGIKLTDLYIIAASDHQITIWERLQQLSQLTISHDARIRLTNLVNVLAHSLQQRQRLPLDQWVERAWLALGGPACLPQASDGQDIRTYFKLLTRLQQDNDLPDINALANHLNRLYASVPTITGNAVEVMTIHKAKGLEFDCVILPGLHRPLAADDPQLLLSMERPTLFGHPDLLLAPIKAATEEYDAIYAYLYHEEKKRASNEIIRLLYVAATRAKSSLHLTAVVNTDELNPTLISSPPKNSLLAQFWPALANAFLLKIKEKPIFTAINTHHATPKLMPSFKRLTSDWSLDSLIRLIEKMDL